MAARREAKYCLDLEKFEAVLKSKGVTKKELSILIGRNEEYLKKRIQRQNGELPDYVIDAICDRLSITKREFVVPVKRAKRIDRAQEMSNKLNAMVKKEQAGGTTDAIKPTVYEKELKEIKDMIIQLQNDFYTVFGRKIDRVKRKEAIR